MSLSETPERAAVHPAYELRIVSGLVLGFGGLVLLAVVAVLALGLWSARTNTLDLLRDKAEAVMAQLVARIELHLRPTENQLRYLGRQIELGRVDVETAEFGTLLAGALSATPEVRSLVFIHADGRMLRALRSLDGVELTTIDVRAMPVILGGMAEGRSRSGLYWGEVIRPETTVQVLVNGRYPVRAGERYLGLLAATVQIDQLSQLLDDAASGLGGRAYVLYGERLVLAHRRLIEGLVLPAGGLLPRLEDVGDPVLDRLAAGAEDTAGNRDFAARTGIRLLDAAGKQYALLSRTLAGYSDQPWLVGVYFPAADLLDELSRLRWAAFAGLAVLLAALALAYLYARYLTQPVIRLAAAARSVSGLALDRVERLERGPFRELNAAAQAFNSMVVGLRWFEAYVPKTLVRRLVRSAESEGERAALESKERVVTVMFTDIAGFTARSERLPARAVADLLNRHFAVITDAVEAESGTVDKFIGDSVMAFWGAPEKQKDHALRACRAARAIAAAVARENAELRAAGEPPMQIRIGVHTGPVVVGNIGAPGRINYTIVGDTVNIASRLEQLGRSVAPASSDAVVLLSAATLEAAKPDFPLRPIGSVEVRGRREPIEVFALVPASG